MTERISSNLHSSNLVQGDALNLLKAELRHLFVNLKLKGRHDMDASSLYSKASAACFKDSFLATGTFVSRTSLGVTDDN